MKHPVFRRKLDEDFESSSFSGSIGCTRLFSNLFALVGAVPTIEYLDSVRAPAWEGSSDLQYKYTHQSYNAVQLMEGPCDPLATILMVISLWDALLLCCLDISGCLLDVNCPQHVVSAN